MEDNKKLSPSKEKPGKYRVIEILVAFAFGYGATAETTNIIISSVIGFICGNIYFIDMFKLNRKMEAVLKAILFNAFIIGVTIWTLNR